MKSFLLAFSLFSSAALANGVDNMVAQCEEVMRCGLCQVSNDKLKPGATKLVSYVDVNGRPQAKFVLAEDYDWLRNTGYAKTKDGKFLMCERVKIAMVFPNSTRAMGARALFSQTWDRQTYCPAGK